ncbi:MAG: hypothetical protein ACE5EF_08510, partial [Dehalococcoidia bacterium]
RSPSCPNDERRYGLRGLGTLLGTYEEPQRQVSINASHLFIAQPPLYRVAQGRNVTYLYSEEELESFSKGKRNIHVQRFKGLGEMNAEQLWETTMKPDARTLLRVDVHDAAAADIIFSELMGDEVIHRRRFIQAHAKQVKNLDV